MQKALCVLFICLFVVSRGQPLDGGFQPGDGFTPAPTGDVGFDDPFAQSAAAAPAPQAEAADLGVETTQETDAMPPAMEPAEPPTDAVEQETEPEDEEAEEDAVSALPPATTFAEDITTDAEEEEDDDDDDDDDDEGAQPPATSFADAFTTDTEETPSVEPAADSIVDLGPPVAQPADEPTFGVEEFVSEPVSAVALGPSEEFSLDSGDTAIGPSEEFALERAGEFARPPSELETDLESESEEALGPAAEFALGRSAFFANSPSQSESDLDSLEESAVGPGDDGSEEEGPPVTATAVRNQILVEADVNATAETLASPNVITISSGLTYTADDADLVVQSDNRNVDPDVVAFKGLATSALETNQSAKLGLAVALSFTPDCECSILTPEELDDIRIGFRRFFRRRNALDSIVEADANTQFEGEVIGRRLEQAGKSPVNSFVCAYCWPRRACRRVRWCRRRS